MSFLRVVITMPNKTAPRYKDPRTVLEEVERYLDSADRLFSSGKLLETLTRLTIRDLIELLTDVRD